MTPLATIGLLFAIATCSRGEADSTAGFKGGRPTAAVHVEKTRASVVPSFRNRVLPVLTKAGCNGGSCHGALAGKGGLKLSLRGFDPASDYDVLTRQSLGRRIVKGDPAHSLFLQKPSGVLGHGGGVRLPKGSADYSLIREWIAAGAPGPSASDPTLSSLEVKPLAARLKEGDGEDISVRAHYSDGRVEDVTRWVKFGTSDSTVAAVDEAGRVKVTGSGEAAITIWFNSKVAFARITSPFPSATSASSAVNDRLFIDRLVDAKLEALNLPASPPCTDGEFIRRAYLDACGMLPKPAGVRAFLADRSPDKRAKLIDTLLARPEFVDYWTYKWSDLLLVSSKKLQGRSLTSFYGWIRQSVAENKPWDRFASDLLTAKGSTIDNGAANFYVLHKEPIDLTETTTQAFLGMSVQCARCHNHPLEKWTQRDYYQFANLFARVRLKNGDQPGEVLVLTSEDSDINHPRLGRPLPPRPLEGKEIALDARGDRRAALVEWLTARGNPYFAKALVNRVWRNFMGRGLVEVEDDLRLTNPPSNQELFDALAADFVQHGYDVKRLIRQIMTSEAYQRSSTPVGISARDDRYYSHYLVRRLPAEVILDAVSQVTGVPTDFPGYQRGTRTLQLRDSEVSTYFLAAFGRPERVQTCSCERHQEPSVAQALHLANGDTLNQKLRSSSGEVESLFIGEATDEEIVDELYLSALGREPSPAERTKLLAILAQSPDDPFAVPAKRRETRRAAIEDLFWAVLTDREFLFNH